MDLSICSQLIICCIFIYIRIREKKQKKKKMDIFIFILYWDLSKNVTPKLWDKKIYKLIIKIINFKNKFNLYNLSSVV